MDGQSTSPRLTDSEGVPKRTLTQARWLFGSAAIYNISGALAFLFLRPWIEPLLRLDPVAGTNLPTLYLACGFVILFGYIYVLLARDPLRYRHFIPVTILGKSMATVCFVVPWLAGQAPWTLAAVGAGDPVYAVLFLLFWRSLPDVEHQSGR